jgi:SAM-dependent methyltransferase
LVLPAHSPNLPPASVDLAFVCDVYHHFERPVTYMRALAQALKPDGQVILIDFHRIPEKIWSRPPHWVLEHVRAGQEVFTAEIIQAGFTLEREVMIESLRENYFMIFRKAAPEQAA